MSYIEFNNVVKEYQSGQSVIRANDGVTFTIEEGEFAAILGPSGAGKSTTLNLLGGMDKATSGQILVGGEDISNYSSRQLTKFRRNNIGFVFQNYNLVANLTALENVELSIYISQSEEDARDILKICGLEDRADNFPAQLSGGEQQRVSIARAIASRPKLLLADEPTGALDYETGKQILQLLKDMNEELGTTMVIITHNAMIAQIADRVIRIHNGRVINESTNPNPTPVSQIEW